MQLQTKTRLSQCLCDELVENQAQTVISKQTGCKAMLKNNKLDELKDMYTLFCKVESTLKYILEEMQPYIEERGSSFINDDELKKDPVKFTKALLGLKKEMDDMVNNCFANDPKFNQTRDKSFQNFMNNWHETPLSIATYCDQLF